jgi:hypothetical protein
MTASNYTSHISGIMDAVHVHLNFKLSALRIALSKGIKNVPHHQVIPIESYSLCFKRIKGNFITQNRLGNVQSPEKTMTVLLENVVIFSTLYHLKRPLILITKV